MRALYVTVLTAPTLEAVSLPAARGTGACAPLRRVTPPDATTAERRYAELCDLLPDALLLTDPAGRILEANAAFSRLIGYARGYARGKPITTVIDPSSVALVRQRLERARDGGGVQTFETRLRPLRQRSVRTARIWLRPVRDVNDAFFGLHWLVRDITVEAEVAERLRTLEAAHAQELRTRTMELEATVRLLQVELTALRGTAPLDSSLG